MVGRFLLLVALFALGATPALARYTDPDAPEVQAAALAALPGAKALDLDMQMSRVHARWPQQRRQSGMLRC